MSEKRIDKTERLVSKLQEGQSIKIIGLGGIGSIVARYGSVFLASLDTDARVVLIDGDTFEPKNEQRMIFSDFGNKAEVIRNELSDAFKNTRLMVMAVPEYVSDGSEKAGGTDRNIDRLVRDGDIVIVAVDNHVTRKMISDHCKTLDNVVLISGGNDGVEVTDEGKQKSNGAYANVQIYVREEGKELSPPIDSFLHPEIAEPTDNHPGDPNCTELLASVPQILFTNLAAASLILNALWLYLCGKLHYGELSVDIAEGRMIPWATVPGPHLAAMEEAANPKAERHVAERADDATTEQAAEPKPTPSKGRRSKSKTTA